MYCLVLWLQAVEVHDRQWLVGCREKASQVQSLDSDLAERCWYEMMDFLLSHQLELLFHFLRAAEMYPADTTMYLQEALYSLMHHILTVN